MTEKIYESDAKCIRFTATVLSCEENGGKYAVVLDRTAFYPEGGGQPYDTGTLGGAEIVQVHIADGVIVHTALRPLAAGSQVEGEIDWARRLDHMQQHTGEHILSGILHREYGANNVGFHIGDPAVRMDMDLPLTDAQLAAAERLANAAVRANTPVHCWVPDAEELARTPYRSKKELEDPVRLVEAGGDVCACCGTHLEFTGEVGLIKILSAQKYKGGVRLAVACGERAFDAVGQAYADAQAAGKLVSAAPGKLEEALERALAAAAAEKQRAASLQNSLAQALAACAQEHTPCVYVVEGAQGDGARRIAMAVSAKTGAHTLILTPAGQGISYALAGGENEDVRELARTLNQNFAGRGGGKSGFCQGSFAVPLDDALLEQIRNTL